MPMQKVIVVASPHSRNDVTEEAVRRALPDFKIVRLNKKEQLNAELLSELSPTWIFFPHWSWIIPQSVHSNFRCVVFHMTDLPYGRGGSPLQNLIVRGHKDTQISALRCIEDVDAGPIYLKRPMTLTGNAEDILKRAAVLISEMIVEIVSKGIKPVLQEGRVAKFQRRTRAQSSMDEVKNVSAAYDFIRMLDADGYPRAFLETQNLIFEFENAIDRGEHIVAQVKIRSKR